MGPLLQRYQHHEGSKEQVSNESGRLPKFYGQLVSRTLGNHGITSGILGYEQVETSAHPTTEVQKTFDDLMGRLGVAKKDIRKGKTAHVPVHPQHLENKYIVSSIQDTVNEKKYAENLTLEVISDKQTVATTNTKSEQNIESINSLGVRFGIEPFYMNKSGEIVPSSIFKFMCVTLRIIPRFLRIESEIYNAIMQSDSQVYRQFRIYLDKATKKGMEIMVYKGGVLHNGPRRIDLHERQSMPGSLGEFRTIDNPIIKMNGEVTSSELLTRSGSQMEGIMLFEYLLKSAIERAKSGKKTILNAHASNIQDPELMPIIWRSIRNLTLATRNLIYISIAGDALIRLDNAFFNQLELLRKSGLKVCIDNPINIEGSVLLGKQILDGCIDTNRGIPIDMIRIHWVTLGRMVAGNPHDIGIRDLDNSLAMLENPSGEKITILFSGIRESGNINKIISKMDALRKSQKEIFISM